MLEQPHYAVGDRAEIVDLARANPWATSGSVTGDGADGSRLVVSHLPIIGEEGSSAPDADVDGVRRDTT